MKNYNKLKNMATAFLTSILYLQILMPDCTLTQKAFGTACVFFLVFIVMTDLDKVMHQKSRERKGQVNDYEMDR